MSAPEPATVNVSFLYDALPGKGTLPTSESAHPAGTDVVTESNVAVATVPLT